MRTDTEKLQWLILSLVCPLGMAACTTSQSAQELALATLKATAAYENEIDKKINAEKQFYEAQLGNIRSALGGVPLEENLSAKDREKELRKTWLYGNIRTNAARAGRLTAGKIMSQPPPLSAGLMIEFLEKGLKEDVEAIAQARAKQEELTRQLVTSLAPVKKQKNRLSAIRKGLAILAAGGGEGDRFALALGFAKALAKEIAGGISGN